MLLMLPLSSAVIDNLITQHGDCDYRDQPNQTLINILGSLLRQHLVTASHVPEAITTLLESIKKKNHRVELCDVSQMLKVLLPQLNSSFYLFGRSR